MLAFSPKHRIFLAVEPIDFRRGLDSISRLCLNIHGQAPYQGHYFVFRNKRKTDLKCLYYDSQGFCLLQKRLSAGRFKHWPTAQSKWVNLTPTQMNVLLHNGNPTLTQESQPFKSL